jgi:hypothetical protein
MTEIQSVRLATGNRLAAVTSLSAGAHVACRGELLPEVVTAVVRRRLGSPQVWQTAAPRGD